MPNFYLIKIADFNFKISFDKTPWTALRDKTETEFKHHFSRFITTNKFIKLDCHIRYIHRQFTELLSNKKKDQFYTYLFSKKANGDISTSYQNGTLHLLLIIKIILQDLLSKNKGFLLHCSAAKINNKAFLFVGGEGAGKSTIVKLLIKEYQPLTDDIAIIKKTNQKYCLFQSPFIESNQYEKSNKKFTISKIFFLKKSNTNFIEEINKKYTINKLFQKQILFIEKNIGLQIPLIKDFISNHKFFVMHFTKNSSKLISLFKNYK